MRRTDPKNGKAWLENGKGVTLKCWKDWPVKMGKSESKNEVCLGKVRRTDPEKWGVTRKMRRNCPKKNSKIRLKKQKGLTLKGWKDWPVKMVWAEKSEPKNEMDWLRNVGRTDPKIEKVWLEKVAMTELLKWERLTQKMRRTDRNNGKTWLKN